MIVNCSSYIFLLFTSSSFFSCEVSLFFFLLLSYSVFLMLLAVMYCKKDIVLIASRWMRQNQQEIGTSMRGWRPSCDKSWQRRLLTNPVYNSTRRSFRLGQRALKMFIWANSAAQSFLTRDTPQEDWDILYEAYNKDSLAKKHGQWTLHKIVFMFEPCLAGNVW